MKQKWLIVFLALSLLAGVSLIAYPVVSAWYYERHQSEVCADYLTEVADMEAERRAALWQQAEEYNRQLADGVPCTLEYNNQLNPNGDGMMGYVEIPKLSVSLPIYHGTGDAVLKEGAGHMKSSSLPVGGSGTHTVISAHSGMASARMFTDLEQLELGDRFSLYVLGTRLTYEVDRILTVLPTQTEYLAIEPERDEATLLTCTPYGVNTHRLLVRGHRIADAPKMPAMEEAAVPAEITQATWLETYWPDLVLGATLAAGLVFLFRRRRGAK